MYIDCTGNGDVAAAGRRARASPATRAAAPWAPPSPSSWRTWTGRWPSPTTSDPYFTRYAARGIAEGRLPETLRQIYLLKGLREGSVYFNTVTVTGVDGADMRSVSEATVKARRQVLALASFCRDEMPGFEHAYVSRIGPVVGVREGRRLEGVYTLTRDDVARATKFDDGIVAADSPLDEVFRDDEAALYSHEAALPPGDYYTIPFRSLVPRSVGNLLFAGRARSVDLAAYATGRGMPQCMLMGQAAGVGATMALGAGCDVQHIDRPALVERLVALGVNGIGGRAL